MQFKSKLNNFCITREIEKFFAYFYYIIVLYMSMYVLLYVYVFKEDVTTFAFYAAN